MYPRVHESHRTGRCFCCSSNAPPSIRSHAGAGLLLILSINSTVSSTSCLPRSDAVPGAERSFLWFTLPRRISPFTCNVSNHSSLRNDSQHAVDCPFRARRYKHTRELEGQHSHYRHSGDHHFIDRLEHEFWFRFPSSSGEEQMISTKARLPQMFTTIM
jgi:hypothetical protein